MKDNFLLKKSQREVFDTLTDEEAGILIKGIFKYLDTNDSGLTGMLKAIFIPIRKEIDKNEKKYQSICERNKENINKRWQKEKIPNDTTVYESIPNGTDNNHISYITNHNSFNQEDKKKDIRGMGEEEKGKEKEKPPKKKFGEYQNVLLTEKEYESLQKAYSNYEELIKYLDEYIEDKGYKAKSHYLSIKRWVVGAVKENNEKNKQSKSNNPFLDYAKEKGINL